MRNHSAFSLMNTLLFLGALVVATAILYPFFGRPPHQLTPRSSCQSNLKQIEMGFKQYTQDYDEKFPLLNANHLPATNPPSTGWVNSLQAYVKDLQIFQCPTETNSTAGKTDYAYNSPVIAGKNEVKFKNADSTIIMCETDETEGSLASASAPLVINRHVDGSNYVFIDGHVLWLNSTKPPTSSKIPATGKNFTFGK